MGGEERERMDWEKRQEWGNKGDGMEKDKERERKRGVKRGCAPRFSS